jgi:multidrug efflux pump subunit AcrA (membrane-fusion protein)
VTGHLDFLDLSIDEATGTAALRAEFPNPNRRFFPASSSARASLPATAPTAS